MTSVLFLLLYTFGEKIFYLTVYGTKIVLGPGGNIHDLTETGKDFGAEFREKVAIDMARSGIRKGLHEINNAEGRVS